jgi:protein-S-isoprenylcysteine O-methyltransferase Ste14
VPTAKASSRLVDRLDLDMIEKFLVATFMAVLAARMVPVAIETRALAPILLVLSEGLVVLFILLRRPTDTISKHREDWLVGLMGTLLPLMAIPPQGSPVFPIHIGEALMVTGFLLQLSAKLVLRRSFGVVAANRGVKASGPYRLVRHPMYAGYTLTQIGFLLSGPVLWNFLIYGLTLFIACRRIIAEERILGQDEAYQALVRKVRYRLLPGVF